MRQFAVIVLRYDLRAALFRYRLRYFDGVALDGEIDIEHGKTAQHVAHGPARQEDVQVSAGGGGLDLGDRPALVGAQVALEHKHVIAHCSGLSN